MNKPITPITREEWQGFHVMKECPPTYELLERIYATVEAGFAAVDAAAHRNGMLSTTIEEMRTRGAVLEDELRDKRSLVDDLTQENARLRASLKERA